MKKTVVYTSKNCPYCKKTIELFKQHKIEFIEKDSVENQADWVEVHTLTGIPMFPTTHHNGNYYIPGRDYNNPEQLISILKANPNNDFPVEVKLQEAMKTLIYTINQGMSRMFNEINKLKDEHKSTS